MANTNDIKLIPLSQGKFATIDADDYELVKNLKWHTSSGYAMHNKWDKKTKKPLHVLMHRLITNCPDGMQVDHINGDKLDNRKGNLRLCTLGQNNAYRPKSNHKPLSSKYKGVYSSYGKWRAQIRASNKLIYLGTFETELDAARAYNEAAIANHGEFAWVNIIEVKND